LGMWAIEDHYTKKDSLEFGFWGMKNIEELLLPKSLKYLGEHSFYGCHKLKTITIPKGTNMGYAHGEASSFWSCISLENILVEEGNTSLYSEDGCLYKTEADGKKTLLAVPAARTSFTIPEDVDITVHYSFPQGCQLEELTLGAHSPALEPYYFENLLMLRRFNVNPDNSLYSEIDGVLYDKEQKEIVCYPCYREGDTYTIKEGVTLIGANCFNSCYYLKDMVIPEGVTEIEFGAFFRCVHLESITLPSSLEKMGSHSLQQSSRLKTIKLLSVTPPEVYDECVFVGVNPDQILVPEASVSLYQNADYWKDFASVIKAF